jgi:YVTN family beta-propeller protein
MLSSKSAISIIRTISRTSWRLKTAATMCLLVFGYPSATQAQTITATVAAGSVPNWMAVNPVTNKIYVANQNSNDVTIIDGANNTSLSVPAGTTPVSVAVNPLTNKVYVANEGVSPNAGSVTIIDGATATVTGTIPAGRGSFSVAVNPVTNKVYVANQVSNDVTVIDAANNNQTSTVTAGQAPYSVAVNPVTNKVYVANQNSNNVTVIDAANNNQTSTIMAGQGPYSVAVNPATNRIYVANAGDNTVTVIDGANSGNDTVVPVGYYPISVAVNSVTNRIYVSNDLGNTVTVIDGASNNPTTLNVGSFPVSVAVNATTNQIYVADDGGGESVIDGATNTVKNLPASGTYPNVVAVNPVTNKAYISNYGSNNVTVIDGATYGSTTLGVAGRTAVNPATDQLFISTSGLGSAPGTVTILDGFTQDFIKTIQVGTSPMAGVVNPITNKIYVANTGSNSVTVIDGVGYTSVNLVAGTSPSSVAVNAVTNMIYVVDTGNYPTFYSSLTIIDGSTNSTSTISLEAGEGGVAINSATNKIYVIGGGLGTQPGRVTVIDGADTSNTQTITLPYVPNSLAVNSLTNQIYFANTADGEVTVMDGASNVVTATVAAGSNPSTIAVNPVTNKIFVSNYYSSTVTMIDGATLSTMTFAAGSNPQQPVVNPVTDKVYVPNFNSNSITVIDGSSNSTTTIPAGSNPSLLAVNLFTNQVYVTNFSSNVTVISEQQASQVSPAALAMPLHGNATSDSNPGFLFGAASYTAPVVTTPDGVFFQVDTWQGSWSSASGAFSTFAGSASSLKPGLHILYTYASDGQEATSTQFGSPLTGSIEAYTFIVTGSGTLLPQTLTFARLPAQEEAGASVTLSATASTPITFSSQGGPCSVSGTTLTFNGACICNVSATAYGNTVYAPATASQEILVDVGQTITFGAIPSQTIGTQLVLSATASSGLTVAFTSTAATICSVSGTTATLLGAGTCSIQASQPGNSSYTAAPPVTQSFTVTTQNGLGFIPVAPCRVVDTRMGTGSLAGPSMGAGSTRSFPLPMGSCGLPATASAYSLNVTVVPKSKLSYLAMWPTGQPQPVVSTLNSPSGRVVANAALVPAGTNGAVNVYVTDQTDVIIDVNGYFGDAESAGALTFVPLIPCRVEDTRTATGPFGGPILSAGSSRSFTVPASGCGVPSSASAYSLNATVVPTSVLHYLTLYPAGSSQPNVSTLNSSNGQVVANAALVRAGTAGAIDAYVTDQTNLITDINGYFTSSTLNPLVFNTVTPCRVADTRQTSGPLGGPIMAANSTRTFPIPASSCGIPASASAYALNVTVVPTSALNYLTLWPAGEAKPTVSTLNSASGQIVANAALVPAGTSGSVDVFVTNQTHVLIDIVGYFSAP